MAITNAQQYQQLVNPPMKGNKRPGYRGPGEYQGGTSSSGKSSNNSKGGGFTGGGGGGADASTKSFDKSLNPNRPGGPIGRDDSGVPGPDRRAVSQFSQYGRNVMNQNLRPERFAGIKSLASRFNPLSFILGLINPALGLASRFVTQQVPETFQTFKDSPTLVDFIKNMREEDVSPFSVDSGRGSGLRQPITPIEPIETIEPISESDMSIPMIERISESDMSLLTPEQKRLIGLQNRFNFDDGGVIGGGIMDAAGRQNYFLGKLVKKATRAVKKIVKSPVGKLGLGALVLGATGGFGKDAFLRKTLLPRLISDGKLTGMGKLGLGAAISAAPLLFQKEEEQGEGLETTGSVGGQIDPKAYSDPYSVLFPAFRAEGSPKEGEKGIMKVASAPDMMDELNDLAQMLFGKNLDQLTDDERDALDDYNKGLMAVGGRVGLQTGGITEPVAKRTMPLLDMDGQEMDLRAEGGFVPIGRMEKADDVPARLSKNEFVFTADAVRNAGDGDVDKGAEVMYNMMKNLESGGDVSEESQGLEGARNMFQTSKRLEEVI